MLNGRLDMQGVMAVDQEFQKIVQSHNAVIVDLAGIEFLASMGLRSLIMAAKSINARSGQIVLLNPTQMVEQVLRASGTDSLIVVVHDRTEAERLVMA
jgi:anti-anti-sigma factor